MQVPRGGGTGSPDAAVFLSRLLEALPMSVFAVEAAAPHRFVAVNAAGLGFLGLSREEVVGRAARDVGPVGVGRLRQRLLDEALATGRPQTYRVAMPDGSRAFETSLVPLADATGATSHVVGFTLDVTEQTGELRHAEEDLRASEATLAAAQRLASVGSWSFELSTERMTWSDELFRILGFDPDAIDVTLGLGLEVIHPDDWPAAERALAEAREVGRSPAFEHRIRRADGEERWVRSNVGCAFDREGNAARMFGAMQDVTEQRAAEAERRRLEEGIRQGQKLESLGVLAGGIAHDFNNLLVAILGNAGVALVELPEGSPARPIIAEIGTAAERAADLTRQMLAYAGRGRFRVECLDLSEAVEEMGRLLHVSVAKSATTTFDLARDLPPIEADPTQVRQVAMNLIINASDAVSDAGGVIAVRTGCVAADRALLASTYLDDGLPAGTYVFLEVADTGVGMDEDTLQRLFDPFFTTKFTGRGLGLAAVLGIVRSHRGAVEVESEPGRGSRIRVLFPAAPEDVTGGAAALPDGTVGVAAGTVLVADDDDTVRRVARRILERAGFRVLGAADGREAIEVFRDHAAEVTAVLLDVTMPHVDGVDAFAELRRIDPGVRVVLTSGYDETEATAAFRDGGLAGFVQKPYRPEDLVTRVLAAIRP